MARRLRAPVTVEIGLSSRVSVKQTNPGWAKKIAARVTELANKEVAAGFPRGSKAGSETYDNGASVLDVAIWNQFGADINHPGGTPYFIRADGMAQFVEKGSPGSTGLPKTKPHQIKIPARPFIDNAVTRIEQDNSGSGAYIAKQVIDGTMSADAALKQVALVAETAIREAITDDTYEPNAPSTIKRKRSSKPLIDTGKMRQAVTSVVRDRSR